MKKLLSLLLVCFFASSCFATDDDFPWPLYLAAIGAANANKIRWVTCPSYLKGPENLQCTILKQPLNHSDPTGKQIEVLLARSLGTSKEKKGEVWFVTGGPGSSISAINPAMDIWSGTHPDYDYYSMEHRGVGYSTFLRCEAEPESKECRDELVAQWGEGLGFFNPTQAAHDLAASMERAGENSKKYLYGISYGTYLVQRFISIYDFMLQGAIIDGIVPAAKDENGFSSLDTYDSNYNDLALSIATMCDEDVTCSAKLHTYGADTTIVIQNTFNNIDAGTICEPLKTTITRKSLRNKSAELISNFYGRLLYPALLYRINRCSSEDVGILTTLFEDDNEPATEEELMNFSDNLNVNIAVSELMTGKSLAIAQEETPIYIASPDALIDSYQHTEVVQWPQYPLDQYSYKWAETDLPLLMLSGNMDPQTPLTFAQRAKDHYTGEFQYLVVLPGAPHGSLIWSPVQNVPIDDANSCGIQVMFNFIADVTKRPDISCIDNMVTP